MNTRRTIRNCGPVELRTCPQVWDHLAETDRANVRHCGECDKLVHFCVTDEETIAHARMGDCIARTSPDESELPQEIHIGQPTGLPKLRPEEIENQRAAVKLQQHEGAIDRSIREADRRPLVAEVVSST